MKKLKKPKKNVVQIKVNLYASEAGGGCTNGTCSGAGNNCTNKSTC